MQGTHERRALFRGSAGMTELARRGPANLRVGFAAASRTVKESGRRTGAEPEPKEKECKRYR